MSKFRLRDVEAVQWNKPGDHSAVRAAEFKPERCPVCGKTGAAHGRIVSSGNSIVEVHPGDWIIENFDGRQLVMTKKAFGFLYEPTDEPVYDSGKV